MSIDLIFFGKLYIGEILSLLKIMSDGLQDLISIMVIIGIRPNLNIYLAAEELPDSRM